MNVDKYTHSEVADKVYSYWQKNNLLKNKDWIFLNLATWRNGYAEDCKSLYPSSILGVASK